MSKYIQLNFNIEPELRERMAQYVDDHEDDFEDVSSFLRKIIRQRIDPTIRKSDLKKELFELIRDPETMEEMCAFVRECEQQSK